MFEYHCQCCDFDFETDVPLDADVNLICDDCKEEFNYTRNGG